MRSASCQRNHRGYAIPIQTTWKSWLIICSKRDPAWIWRQIHGVRSLLLDLRERGVRMWVRIRGFDLQHLRTCGDFLYSPREHTSRIGKSKRMCLSSCNLHNEGEAAHLLRTLKFTFLIHLTHTGDTLENISHVT